jgi:hypothetical protein
MNHATNGAQASIAPEPHACEACGNEIPRKRLEAVPGARLCVGCQSCEDVPIKDGDRRVMNALVQRAECDLDHHKPEPHK